MKCGFSTHFSMARIPNRVLTLLKMCFENPDFFCCQSFQNLLLVGIKFYRHIGMLSSCEFDRHIGMLSSCEFDRHTGMLSSSCEFDRHIGMLSSCEFERHTGMLSSCEFERHTGMLSSMWETTFPRNTHAGFCKDFTTLSYTK